jgi:hypothetical protein
MSESAPLPRRPLAAGQDIDAWCTRCRMDLGHRIVAMVGRTPKRVVCMTCHSEHNYRPPKSAEGKAGVAKKKPAASGKKSKASSARAEWEARIRSGAPFRRYSISESFSEGDLLTHKKFGEGYVSAIVSETKVTVVFSDGERTLVQGAK